MKLRSADFFGRILYEGNLGMSALYKSGGNTIVVVRLYYCVSGGVAIAAVAVAVAALRATLLLILAVAALRATLLLILAFSGLRCYCGSGSSGGVACNAPIHSSASVAALRATPLFILAFCGCVAIAAVAVAALRATLLFILASAFSLAAMCATSVNSYQFSLRLCVLFAA